MRAPKLTCNETVFPYFQQQQGCVGETTMCNQILYALKKKYWGNNFIAAKNVRKRGFKHVDNWKVR